MYSTYAMPSISAVSVFGRIAMRWAFRKSSVSVSSGFTDTTGIFASRSWVTHVMIVCPPSPESTLALMSGSYPNSTTRVLFLMRLGHADPRGAASPTTCGLITGSVGALYEFT